MADRSSAVKAMRDMADSSHGCNSCSAIVLRRRKLRASVSSYAAASILLFPQPLEPRDGGGRQPLGVRAEEGGQRLAEVARTDALEVEPGDQLLDTLGLAQVGRQDRRGELLALLGRPAVVDPGLSHPDRPH